MKGEKLRICGDFRSTVNRVTETESYPFPRIEDIYATLSGGTISSKLDFSNAYLQILLAADYRKYTTINTPHGPIWQITIWCIMFACHLPTYHEQYVEMYRQSVCRDLASVIT